MDARQGMRARTPHGMMRLLMAARLLAIAFITLVLVVTLAASPSRAAPRATCQVKDIDTGRAYPTLQAAVDAAREGDHLTVRGSCVGSTGVYQDLSIRGVRTGRSGLPVLAGDGRGRVLGVADGITVTISDLIIQGGRELSGGGVSNSGVLILTDVIVRDNRAPGSGGGVYNDGTLTLDGSTRIVENTTIDGGGGGVYNAGILTLAGTASISGNVGGRNGGGGVWNDEGGTLTLNDRSAISRNVSDGPGGGVNNEGDTLTLNDASMIVGNRTRSIGWDGEGGGVWNQGHLAMNDTSCICDNHARGDGGGVRNIFLWSGDEPLGSFTMAPTSSITANTARGEGGGILTVDDPSAFSGVVCGAAGDANVHRNGPDDCLYRKASGAIGDWPGEGAAPPATAETIPRVEVDLPGSVGVIDHDIPPAEPSVPDSGAPPVATSADLTPSGAERVLPRSSGALTPVRDGRGYIWALGDGLRRFSDREGRWELAGDWSLSDDVAFAALTMAPAKDGGVWLGGGWDVDQVIRRFDGSRFTDIIASPGGRISEIVEAPDGALWVIADPGGEDAAVWRWDGASWTKVDHGGVCTRIATIDAHGDPWCVERPDSGPLGVARWDDAVWRHFGSRHHPWLAGEIRQMAPSATGGVFVIIEGRGRPLAYDGASWEVFRGVPPSSEPWRLVSMPGGDTLLASQEGWYVQHGDGTVDPYDGRSGDFADFGAAGLVGVVRGIVVVDEGAISFVREGTAPSHIWAPPGVQMPDSVGSLPGELAFSGTDAWISDGDAVWRCALAVPGTETRCSRLTPDMPVMTEEEDLLDGYVPDPTLAVSPDGTLWATGRGGTARFDGSAWTVVDEHPGTIVAAGSDGRVWSLWLGSGEDTPSSILTELVPAETGWVATRHAVPDWLSPTPTLLPAADGSVWLAGGLFWQELAHFDGHTWEDVRSIAGHPIGGAMWGATNEDGQMWFVVSDSESGSTRLARTDGTGWILFESGATPSAAGLAVGPDGDLWLGGEDGLWRLDGERVIRAGLQGLSHPQPLVVSDDGSVLFLHDGGLYRMPDRAT